MRIFLFKQEFLFFYVSQIWQFHSFSACFEGIWEFSLFFTDIHSQFLMPVILIGSWCITLRSHSFIHLYWLFNVTFYRWLFNLFKNTSIHFMWLIYDEVFVDEDQYCISVQCLCLTPYVSFVLTSFTPQCTCRLKNSLVSCVPEI